MFLNIQNFTESLGINRIRPLATHLRRRASERASGPGHKPQALKQQATSIKLQAPSSESIKPQASSPKQQASSLKPQASSSMIREPRKSFTVLGPRASDHDKCIVWMPHMEGNLMWREPYFIPLAYL